MTQDILNQLKQLGEEFGKPELQSRLVDPDEQECPEINEPYFDLVDTTNGQEFLETLEQFLPVVNQNETIPSKRFDAEKIQHLKEAGLQVFEDQGRFAVETGFGAVIFDCHPSVKD